MPTREQSIKTVLGYMNAAQTILAIYGSPDGPTDPETCYSLLVKLLEDPDLLTAQVALKRDHEVVMFLGGLPPVAPVMMQAAG